MWKPVSSSLVSTNGTQLDSVFSDTFATSACARFEHRCDFYFVADIDNFIRPGTLRELVALNLPIVAPFLRSIGQDIFTRTTTPRLMTMGIIKNATNMPGLPIAGYVALLKSRLYIAPTSSAPMS